MEERSCSIITCQLVTRDFDVDLGTQSQPLALLSNHCLKWPPKTLVHIGLDVLQFSHSCPHLSTERAYQISLVGTPPLAQHGKTHLSGQSIVCYKLHHTALAPRKVGHGEREQWALLHLHSCPEHHINFAGDTILQGYFLKWHHENIITGCQVCHVPVAPRQDLLGVQIKPCLSPILALKVQVNLAASLGSFFFAFSFHSMKVEIKSFHRNAILYILLFFFI